MFTDLLLADGNASRAIFPFLGISIFRPKHIDLRCNASSLLGLRAPKVLEFP